MMAKTVLITGASRGIGQELALLFAADGYNLVLVARSEEKLEELSVRLWRDFAVTAYVCPLDLAKYGAAQELVQRIAQWDVCIDVLVNNAGFGYNDTFATSNLDRQQDLLQVDVLAVMELCRLFAPAMIARGSGGILNVASVAGFMPGPYLSTYYASKAFVQSFTQALHVELKPSGISVSALCPGPVSTKFWEVADAKGALAQMVAATPRRVAQAGYRAFKRNKVLCFPGFVAKAAVFLSRLVPRKVTAHISAHLQSLRQSRPHVGQ